LPINWVDVSLNDIGFITGGGTPKTNESKYWDGDIVWVTPADMSTKSRVLSYSKRRITSQGLNNSSAKLINQYSIIMSSRAPIGYLKINSVPVCTSQGCKSFSPYANALILIDFIFYSLLANVKNIQERGSGTTFKEISGNEFGHTRIALPPLNEQKKISLIIQELEKNIN